VKPSIAQLGALGIAALGRPAQLRRLLEVTTEIGGVVNPVWEK
jgi:hypothetical protein